MILIQEHHRMFVNLRGRSTYSMLEGIGQTSELIQRAKALGQTALALTDYNGVYGLHDFYFTATTHNITPLLGVEMNYIPYRQILMANQTQFSQNLSTLTLIAYNNTGYHNLLKLVSEGYNYTFKGIPYLDNEILTQYQSGLVVLVGGLFSYALCTVQGIIQTESLEDHFHALTEIFGLDNVYADVTAQLYTSYTELKLLDSNLISLAHDLSLPVVVSSPYFYPYEDQKSAYETALAIKDNKRTYNEDSRKIAGKHHLLSEDEVTSILYTNGYSADQVSQWIATTQDIADRIDISILVGQQLFPNYSVGPEITDLYNKYHDSLIRE